MTNLAVYEVGVVFYCEVGRDLCHHHSEYNVINKTLNVSTG